MGLKSFHVFFVVVSTLLALSFAGWSAMEYSHTGNAVYVISTGGSLAVAVALVVYGFWFLRKLKNVAP
jgi:flagellar biogenesis protein FliO